MVTTDLYGTSPNFPLSLSVGGDLKMTSGIDNIENSIRMILGTQYGERVMRPTFGCNLKSLVFAPYNLATANLARHYVERGLGQWEPRIDLMSVTIDPNQLADNYNGLLIINIEYRVKATQDIRSMVYPFYLEARK
jgi:phage baseplate assembly protein W